MSKNFNPTGASHRIGCRAGFSEQETWRDALGPAEPLLVFATFGCLDATNWIPTGAHARHGASQERPGAYAFQS